ncbi:MAG: metal-dependent transcriptional regulator [Candidatus Sericytochromatia bacterium]|nr:metal-dependent transcriptional regulator [Candidatus Sericytochromatia bacterium]MEB3221419.1 metal-dependent transcriptional regulator [Candidatus Sericytochromatia bacterium]
MPKEPLVHTSLLGDTSPAIQDYIKAIFKLEDGGEVPSTTAIAEKLGFAPASVSGMLKKLARAGWLTHHPYQGVQLTEPGRRLALELIRHHRLIELYLIKALGYTWDEVDAEAERLEHVISEAMEDRMAAFLKEPTEDPHGDPIPARDGSMPSVRWTPLSAIAPGQAVRIRRVKDSDPALLRYLGGLGMYPHAVLDVLERAPFDGPLTIRVQPGDARHALGSHVTDSVFVECLSAPEVAR